MRNVIRTTLGVTVLILAVLGGMGAGTRRPLTSGQAALPAPTPGEAGNSRILQRRAPDGLVEHPAGRHVPGHRDPGLRPAW
ncbi:hypothetical protein [Streptosporangium sp. NPDC020145]|uniref:hypothetical protein n=1 Tax=unclassified Streptosporangium TaxID=2632669 RepID=UPI00341F8410